MKSPPANDPLSNNQISQNALEFQKSFSFITENLAGCKQPGSIPETLKHDLSFLAKNKITAIISLTEYKIDVPQTFNSLHLPIKDFEPPTIEQIQQMIKFVNENEKTVIHCFAGKGRTGTMLAAYLISKGVDWKTAIDTVRKKRPNSIETKSQEQSLKQFQEFLQK